MKLRIMAFTLIYPPRSCNLWSLNQHTSMRCRAQFSWAMQGCYGFILKYFGKSICEIMVCRIQVYSQKWHFPDFICVSCAHGQMLYQKLSD
jgi:hypothetical protein